MTDLDCLQPRIVTSLKWGREATPLSLSSGEIYQCVMIGSESDADQVEIRLSGSDEFAGEGGRFIISTEHPIIMPLHANGMTIHPMRDVTGNLAAFRHKLQLKFYKHIPPWFPAKRAAKRTDFFAASVVGSFNFPPVPCMGRKRMFWSMNVGGTTPAITVVHVGINAPSHWNYENDRINENFVDFTGVPWDVDWGDVLIEEILKTNVITAVGSIAYQYEGRFDFVQTRVTYTSGTVDSIREMTTVED